MDALRRSAGLLWTAVLFIGAGSAPGCASSPDGYEHPQAVLDEIERQPTAESVARPQAPPDGGVVQTGGAITDTGTTQVRVVALIGSDVVITDDEVWQMVRQRAAEYIRLEGEARTAREKALFDEELLRLIERELVLADFLAKIKKNKPQALHELKNEAERMASRQMRKVRESYKIATEEEFHKLLGEMGVSYKAMLRHMERNYIMQVYLNQFLRDKGKTISLVRLREYYDEHPDEFTIEDRVKWMDLFVSYNRFPTPVEARKYAEELRRELEAGADFSKLAREKGHGDSALRGGEGIGEKRGEVVPPVLEPEVFKLAAGQLSGLIATETGFHVIKVLERDVAGVRPFDEKTQNEIRNRLTAEIQKTEYRKLIDELWRRTTVRVVDDP